MREVFEHYGKTLLEGFICVLLLGVIFNWVTDESGNQGLYEIVGAQIHMHDVDYEGYRDFKEVYKTESQKESPYVYYDGEILEVGRHMLLDYIKAIDFAGNEVSVYIRSIIAPDGEEILALYNHQSGEIEFSKPGIYVVRVLAKDASNKRTEATLHIPMNSKRRSV